MNEAKIRAWVRLIKAGRKTLEDVPEELRDAVAGRWKDNPKLFTDCGKPRGFQPVQAPALARAFLMPCDTCGNLYPSEKKEAQTCQSS